MCKVSHHHLYFALRVGQRLAIGAIIVSINSFRIRRLSPVSCVGSYSSTPFVYTYFSIFIVVHGILALVVRGLLRSLRRRGSLELSFFWAFALFHNSSHVIF